MPNRISSFIAVLIARPRRMAAGGRMFKRASQPRGPFELSRLHGDGRFAFPSLFLRSGRGEDRVVVGVKAIADLAWPWRGVIASLEAYPAQESPAELAASHQVRAHLHPGTVTLGGVPVLELLSIDDGDSQASHYLLDSSYLRARVALRALIERSTGRAMQASALRMEDDASGHGGLYLDTADGAVWLHADPDDARRARLVRVRLR